MRADLATATARAATGHAETGRQATADLLRAVLVKNRHCPNCGSAGEMNGNCLRDKCGAIVSPIGDVSTLEDVA
jgi:hypothetical protein